MQPLLMVSTYMVHLIRLIQLHIPVFIIFNMPNKYYQRIDQHNAMLRVTNRCQV